MILGPSIRPADLDDPYKRTTSPIVTGSSVVAFKTKDFVISATDNLASYGRMARFFNFERITKLGESCFLAASGEMSDFQEVMDVTEDITKDNWLACDGHTRSAPEWHNWLTRTCYAKRNKMEPWYNSFVVGGLNSKNETYLGYTDMWGTHYTDNYVTTGFGSYLGLPLIRKDYKEDMTLEEAKALMAQVMKILYYRDCRATSEYTLYVVKTDGTATSEKLKVDPDWSVSKYVKGYC